LTEKCRQMNAKLKSKNLDEQTPVITQESLDDINKKIAVLEKAKENDKRRWNRETKEKEKQITNLMESIKNMEMK